MGGGWRELPPTKMLRPEGPLNPGLKAWLQGGLEKGGELVDVGSASRGG